MVKKAHNKSKTRANLGTRVWRAICWPFKKIWAGCRAIWNWIAGINLVALLNLALLVSIIVLFTLLIIDLRKSANASDAEIIMQRTTAPITAPAEQPKPRVLPRTRRTTTLPVKSDATRKPIAMPIMVAREPQNRVAINQVARIDSKKIMGDTVIDHYDMTSVLQNGAHIAGNLYIQDLRKYTLPCNITIDGNLILRDVNLLQFCGDFTVRGNIYVSPRSSFGPVPSTARIGGQVIL